VLFALVATFTLLVGGGAARAQAPPPDVVGARVPDGVYFIIGNHQGYSSFMCLDVPNWDTRANIYIQLFPNRNQANQLWRVRRQSGKALDVPNGSLSPGVPIQQYHPHSGDNQRWRFDMTRAYRGETLSRPAFYRIVNKHSGLNLDVPNGIYSTHQSVQQYTPHLGWNQTWLLVPR
jgi:hypothetical protein